MKLSPWVFYVIGLCLMIPLLCFGFFMHYQPNMALAQMNNDAAESYRTEGAKKNKADERRKNARDLVLKSAAEWRRIAEVRTPPTGVERGYAPNLAVNPYQLTVDTQKFRNNLQKAVNAQMRSGGVEVITAPYVQGVDVNAPANSLLASFYNYSTYGFPVVIMNFGPVTVQGKSYKQIFDHVKAWSKLPHYLAVTDSLSLQGTTPSITGTYNLTVIAMIRGTTVGPQAPEGAAASTAGGGSPFGGGGNPFAGRGPGAGPGFGGGLPPSGGGLPPSGGK